MKKIVFFRFNMFKASGAERVVSMLANEIADRYDVTIVSLFKTSSEPFFKLDPRVKLISIFNDTSNIPMPKHFFRIRKGIKRALKQLDIDVLVIAGMEFVPYIFNTCKVKKIISWEHENSFNDKKTMKIGRMISKYYASKIVVLTQRDRKHFIEKYRVPENKVEQIYNPMDLNIEEREYNLDSKRIITPSRIDSRKGFDMLPEVAKIVFEKHPDWQWDIFGDGSYKDEAESKIKDGGLSKYVVFKGFSNDILSLYSDFSFFVSLSRTEGFPMTYIEAHTAKLPIVSFNINCGPDEIIQDGINGYLIEPFDTNEMANKICYLIEHTDVRKQMSDNTGLDKEKLKMKNIVSKWRDLIEEL